MFIYYENIYKKTFFNSWTTNTIYKRLASL